MKILQVVNAFPTKKFPVFGIFIKEQLNSLEEIGVNFDIHFINAKENGKKEYLKSFFSLKKKAKYYDIIHCHHFLTAFVVSLINPKAKIIVSFLSDGTQEFMLPQNIIFKSLPEKMYNFILKRAHFKIFKTEIPEHLKRDETCFHIPNGVDLDFFSPITKHLAKEALGLDDNKKYILFVSSQNLYRPEKRYDLFDKIIKILQLDDPSIEGLPIASVDREKLPYYYNAAELHLLTSNFEGSPNSVKECLACNTPVVSRDVGNVRLMLQNVTNSHCIKSDDAETLASYVKKVLSNSIKEEIRNTIIQKHLDKRSVAISIKNLYE